MRRPAAQEKAELTLCMPAALRALDAVMPAC